MYVATQILIYLLGFTGARLGFCVVLPKDIPTTTTTTTTTTKKTGVDPVRLESGISGLAGPKLCHLATWDPSIFQVNSAEKHHEIYTISQ